MVRSKGVKGGGVSIDGELDIVKSKERKRKDLEKVLLLCTRGVTHRHRHLFQDLLQLLPSGKKENKLDTKKDKDVVNEIAELKGCTSCILFEVRKRMDLYLWMAKTPNGPSIKFHVQNIHTMAELKLTGNHLKGSRAILSFDGSFDEQPHLQLLKELLSQIFGSSTKKHQKTKPFIDHVFSFTFADNRIWFRNYQIVLSDERAKTNFEKMKLVEVGPRFVLNPVKMFAGSFKGQVLYENPSYVSPNVMRADERKGKSSRYVQKVKAKKRRKLHEESNAKTPDEFADLWRDHEGSD
ncbi:Brix domain-containing protein [Chloropicon primus]|uniref:Brix domain-containing protein n=1 Tax=Chloropicon primus TaxID=1764295 RepID=A0A5B8N0L2_9CHLO|nr:Brix domain-containing protein [Chloropicon primus]UPR04510.1 Brix domain-containing protein [Chloropicon primus]|eukprot:QDZ25304.1 Brix domain-containing protein [Chloropicon primus]